MKNEQPVHQQLSYVYNEKFTNISLSADNFSFYKDTMLLCEYLKPEIYTIDSTGCLKPRYRIEFLTNNYNPSFNMDIDVEKMKAEEKAGRLAKLFDSFFETDNYLFFNYSWGLIGSVYVNKEDNTIHNMGFFLEDDFNSNSLPVTIEFVDEEYMYQIEEPSSLIRVKSSYSPYLKKIVDGIEEFDNPVIAKIKLKNK